MTDSGASSCFVSSEWLKQVNNGNLPKLKTDIQIDASAFTGHSIEVTGYVNLGLCFCKNTLKTTCFVVNKSPYQLILGTDFMADHRAKLDFEDYSLTVDGTRLPFQGKRCNPGYRYATEKELLSKGENKTNVLAIKSDNEGKGGR